MSEWETVKGHFLDLGLPDLHSCFNLTVPQMQHIAKKFHQSMLHGLTEQKGSLKMLPSFFNIPTGEESGVFLSIDFGGTNVRVSLVQLLGQGKIRVLKKISAFLRDPGGSYDYTAATATGRELFGFLAEQIAELIGVGETIPLGLTFSFPTKMQALNKAVLIGWTKEFNTRATVGKDVNLLLLDALQKRGLHGIKPVAVINDTVGTLMTAAYSNPRADIGSICGTGHNTCYLEQQPPQQSNPMIINIESGNFNRLPANEYDRYLDLHSEKPGEQVLEKMVSGRYLGALMRLVLLDLVRKGCLFQGVSREMMDFFSQAKNLDAEHISLVLGDNPPGFGKTAAWLKNAAGIQDLSRSELQALKIIVSLLTTRAARLVAATYAGVLRHLDPLLKRPHIIAIDGSLYEKMPGFASCLEKGLDEILQNSSGQVQLNLVKDGSGAGAAIAAAVAVAPR
ncbi:MAG: hexokinase [Peptococcaceae bacterium]|nr:hexokinase [Peptococcaceae bacterium]